MLRQLAEVIDEKSAAMLRIPQDNWGLNGSALPEAVKWSICEAGVKHLLLLGHSSGDRPELSVSAAEDRFAATVPMSAKQSSYDRLLEGAQGVQEQTRRSKAQFVQQVGHLCEIAEVQDAISDGRLQLHALFYVAHSGTFLLFDLVNQQFHAIDG
jgi:hypothetical protein